MIGLPDLRIDWGELEEHGFTLLPALASKADLEEFERVIGEFCGAQIAARGIKQRHADPFIDVMLADEEYWRHLFPLLPRFQVVERITADVGTRLVRSGFLGRENFRAPLIWPYFRADLPNEEDYLLPFHQDIYSTVSAKAWRIWLPMRRVDQHHGSMEVVAGSHKLGAVPHSAGARPEAQVAETALPEQQRVCLELPAGDGVLFHPNLVHRSVMNRSDRVKFVILIQIQDATSLHGPGKNPGRSRSSTSGVPKD